MRPTWERALEYLRAHPGASTSRVARHLGRSHEATYRHILRPMEDALLVGRDDVGRAVAWRPARGCA